MKFNEEKIRFLLNQLYQQNISVDQAIDNFRNFPYDAFGDLATLDTHRELRQGMPEVVFCQGKTPEQVLTIFKRLLETHDRVLGSRATDQIAEKVISELPGARYDPVSRLIKISMVAFEESGHPQPFGVVVTGGTSDLPVAEEAAQTMDFFGSSVRRAYDVGVAGIHRLLEHREMLFNADIVISVAGMEGALTSVVGGLVSCPVIGVPTSVGYGASFNGLAALLSMLNSCAAGASVVNIDNGFGAGILAHKILKRLSLANFNLEHNGNQE